MSLYFKDFKTTLTTIMIVALVGFIGFMFFKKDEIGTWGRWIIVIIVFGLYICCYAAGRDGFDKTVQNAIDGSVDRGVFKLVSFPTIIGCIGASMIIIPGIISIFVKDQSIRQILFFIISSGILLKVGTIEISRIIIFFQNRG